MADNELTPMMRQYRETKAGIPSDAVLLFRMGDFYEMFFEDAQKAAPVLDVVLTRRSGVPMCGIPYHALDNYLPRLLDTGMKVAIAEQVEDPKLAKGIVKREVTRIITPGTVMDNSVLSPQQNIFLASVVPGKTRFGLSCLDVSTADFRLTEVATRDELETEIHRIQARECLVPESVLERWKSEETHPFPGVRTVWTPLPDWMFSYDHADEILKRHFQVASLDGFGCRNHRLGVCAAGAILAYAVNNLRQEATHLKSVRAYHLSDCMILDPISQRNLELISSLSGRNREGTLLQTLDQTVTPMGSRMLKEWILRPLCGRDAIVERLDAVEGFRDDPMTLAEIRETVGTIRDLERITTRLNVGTVNARDFQALARSLDMIPPLKTLLAGFDAVLVQTLAGRLHDLRPLVEQIGRAIADDPPVSLAEGGFIRTGYDARLDEFRSASNEGKDWLASIQSKEQERSGIKSLKIRFNKVFGYYIEISKSNLAMVPPDYIRKQTLVNAERFITPELKEIEDRILGADDKARALELELFRNLCESAIPETAKIQETAAALAALDALLSLAECARRHGYVRPKITDDTILRIVAGRHPVLDAALDKDRFIPNDIRLDEDENRMMIITGPNMAGKSTYIRQVALLVLMAQAGSFIPAAEAEIGLVDRIFTRIGAADDLARGQSTYMVEMVETANILHHATPKSLVILDEIGRGTSTFDGLSIAWAVAEHLLDPAHCRARTLFATHYHELTELAITCRGVKNFNVAVREYGDQIIFLRQIVPGATDKSYGIHVAKLAGIPEPVITRAREVLDNLENSAIGEAGQPVLAKHRTKSRNATPGRKRETREADMPTEKPDQPSLFDWIPRTNAD
jgi:DNA mismatch repair protein MutS